jgi:Fur family peroxide stress response transcriptional regulator
MNVVEIRNRLHEKGLKITPQRIAIFQAIDLLGNHPSAEIIIDHIRKAYPNIATATVYKVLEALVANELIKKVKTERDVMRYDAVMERHHHIYCSDSDRIEDYKDNELNELLEKFFEKKKIPGFKTEDIKLQIIGKYIKPEK